MTNLIETTKTAARAALSTLRGAASDLVSTLAGGFQPGEAHLTGPAGVACVRASSLDEDLDLLLLEIQRRRRGA
jgi:hypothetical protein